MLKDEGDFLSVLSEVSVVEKRIFTADIPDGTNNGVCSIGSLFSTKGVSRIPRSFNHKPMRSDRS
jgi:hypothetical protein